MEGPGGEFWEKNFLESLTSLPKGLSFSRDGWGWKPPRKNKKNKEFLKRLCRGLSDADVKT